MSDETTPPPNPQPNNNSTANSTPIHSKKQAWLPKVGILLLVTVVFILSNFLLNYGRSVGLDKLTTVEGTRPLLVVAAIFSTIVFGGALLLGSIFAADGTFEQRYRHAREIFLVFSGIFGTVIGFYFGAGDSKTAVLKLDAALQETTVSVFANGGVPPYKFTVTYGPKATVKTKENQATWAPFTFDKTKDNILPLTVTVTDNKGTQSIVKLDLKESDLKASGWALPATETKESAPSTTPSSPSKPDPPKRPIAGKKQNKRRKQPKAKPVTSSKILQTHQM